MRAIASLFLLAFSASAEDHFSKEVQPFLKTYCIECHNNDKQKGKVNLESLSGFETNLKAVDLWQEMVYQMEDEEMPPEDEKQPSAEEKQNMMKWITSQIDEKRETIQKSAITHLRRLNKLEYDRTLGDLLKVNTTLNSPSQNFPQDDMKGNFQNNGKALQVSSFHLAAYVEAAEKMIDSSIQFGPRPKSERHTYLPPYDKSNNVLKAARELGKDKFMDLVEKRSFTFHSDQQSGVPESGYYKVSAKVQSRNRIHELSPKGFPIPQDQLLRASIVLSDPSTGNANYLTSSDRTAQEFELPDGEVVEISGRYWINKGYTAKIGFPNSVERFKPAKSKIDRDKYKEYFTKTKGAYFKFLEAMHLMQDHGPVVRVFSVTIEGPFYDQWPKPSHESLVGQETLEEVNLEQAVDKLATRAFRRPLKKNETDGIKTMMKDLSERGFSKEDVLKAGLTSVLSSPQFFYLYENEGTLDDYALASRLSYFLWSTMPDEELMELAKIGELSNNQVLEQQILRMIQDPKIDGFVNNFANAWLELDKLGSMPPDVKTSPEYYLNNLEYAGRQETIHFLKDLLLSNGKIKNFLDSDYTFMNKDLAKFYGKSKVEGYTYNSFQKTPITDKRRGGLLGQMSLLTATANGVDTSPIIRGMWVLNNFFGQEPHAPAGIPAIEPDVRGATTIRELLEKHKTDKNCYSCHKDIDPPGFALENFDEIGRWRDVYNQFVDERESQKRGIEEKLSVDAKGVTPDGHEFDGIIEFKKILLNQQDTFTQTLTHKLLTYATGREVHSFENEKVQGIASGEENFRDLIVNVVQSDLFKRK